MSKRVLLVAALLGISLPQHVVVDGCTAIVVSAGASADGSTMTTHTNDCPNCDSRVAYIPPRDWPEGSMRPVYKTRLQYPRFVGDRSDIYAPKPGQALSQPVGHIPQVPHTYGYWEAGYGYANEHGLTLGESTCAAKFFSTSASALLSITELTQLAMERCRTARCAAEVIGSLAEEHGFHNEEAGQVGGGETLVLGDGAEAWMFHITSTPAARGAMWVAQRVPDGHVTLVANFFMIREVDCADAANFLCSRDLLGAARAARVWDGKGRFDWTKSMAVDGLTFSPGTGYEPIPWYTSARLWRIFSRVSPSLGLRLQVDSLLYPFSVPAERRLTAREVMDLQRDHYEGTEIDLTAGAFAGPFGSPNRPELGVGLTVVKGQFARAISIHKCAFAVVGQSYGREEPVAGLSKLWLGSDTPASSVFVPFYANTSIYAPAYRTGHMAEYDERSAWWVFDFVANWMDLNHRLMKVDVDAKIAELQDEIDAERAAAESRASSELRSGRPEAAFRSLGEFQAGIQRRVVDSWREFGRFLVMKYNDMRINYPEIAGVMGLPAWWLEMNGVDSDPTPKWTRPTNTEPELLKVLGPGPLEKLTPALERVATEPLGLAGRVLAGSRFTLGDVALALAAGGAVFAAGMSAGRRGRTPERELRDWGATPYVQAPAC